MVLVDTSIWVAHLRTASLPMRELLEEGRVACHSFVIGELACGNLNPRGEILSLLNALPATEVASHEEVLELIEGRALMGSGIGYVDAHLLASALLSQMPLWTADRRLRDVSRKLGIPYPA
jgi:predicted nucleic acid-binding protein